MPSNYELETNKIQMAGTHKERIELLERRFDQLDTGFAEMGDQVTKIDRTMSRMERMMAQRGRHTSPRGDSSSSMESDTSETSSEREINPTRQGERHDRPPREVRGGDDPRRGKTKLFLPTFDGSDPITWLSRVEQYFDLNELSRKDRVWYAAYYLEGETNMWWQWLNRVYQKKRKKVRWRDFQKELLIHFGLPNTKIMMKHFRILNRRVHSVNTKRSLKGWQVGFKIGRRRL